MQSLLHNTSLFISPSGLMVLNQTMTILECNEQAAATFGYTRSELLGHNLDLLLPAFIKAKHSDLVKSFAKANASRLLSSGQNTRLFEAVKKDGSPAYIQIGITILENDTNEAKFIVAISDSTELLHFNRELEQTNAALKQRVAEIESLKRNQTHLLHVMSHELKTPLHVTTSLLSLLADKGNTPLERQEFTQTLGAQIDQVVSSLRLLIDYADFQDERFTLQPEIVRLKEFLDSCLHVVKGVYPAQAKNIELLLEADLAQLVIVDRLRIQSVITGIIGNAIEHGNASKIVCKAALDGCTPPNLELSIEDNGCGIPTDIIEKIRQPLANIEYRQKMGSGGLGIGLSMYHQYIQAMGGELQVSNQSSLGGAKLSFNITLARGPAMANKAMNPDATADHPLLGTEILLVDDDSMVTKIVGLRLKRMGAKVTIANNGKEALDYAEVSEGNPFDLILMDLDMPIMNGFDATRAIRQLAAYADIPIFAVTAGLESEVFSRALAAGVTGCYSKPFDPAILVSILNEV